MFSKHKVHIEMVSCQGLKNLAGLGIAICALFAINEGRRLSFKKVVETKLGEKGQEGDLKQPVLTKVSSINE